MLIKPRQLTFQELSERLHKFEEQYGYSTIEFYRRYQNGEMGDNDEWLTWAGYYHLYLTSLPIRQLMQSTVTVSA